MGLRKVRDFLADHVNPRPVGATQLRRLYEGFSVELPRLATDRGLTLEELMPLGRFPDWYAVASQWLAFKASGQG